MLYHKININEIEIRIPLYDDEIFTICPGCGKEHEVEIDDLGMLINEHGLGFVDIALCCKECSTKREVL